ncbi:MAG TPA: amidohydrolase family protein, partial [Thermoanaerobaculia bacterium]|nr:amidohydrolase family protein [Thermoanaerobaculia bacterium]
MRACLLALALSTFPSLLLAQEAPPAAPEIVVLKAARMFDGKGDAVVNNGVVIVEGGTIKAAGTGLAVPAGARVIDLGDATLLPGLIDAHTHMTGESTDNWLQGTMDNLRRTLPEMSIRATAHAQKTLLAGFTTVRDVGSGDWVDVGLRNTIREGVVPGPRMLVASHSLGARGGHCDESGFPYERFGPESGV